MPARTNLGKVSDKKNTISDQNRLFRWCFILLCAGYSLSCGGGGGGSGGGGPPAPPAATVTISSSSSSVSINSTVTISWSSTNASSCTASGAWSGSKTTSGNESFTLSAAADYSFTLICSGTGASGSASVTVNGFQTFSGVTVDGYIRLADIFIDENNNFTRDSSENNTTSDSEGKFTSLKYTSGNLMSVGGVDVDSGNLLDQLLLVNKLSQHNDLLVITPVTSVAALMVNPDNIKAALGIDDSINIATTDPIATMTDGNQYEYLYEKGSQITALVFSMQSALNEINSLTETSETYFLELAKTLEAQYAETSEVVDIEAAAFIDAYVDAVLVTKETSIQDNEKTDIKRALHSMVPVISVRTNAAITTAIANFTTGQFITDFKTLAQGTASAELITSYTTDINALIAADQNIEPDDLGITISLADDSATVDEDASVDIAVLSNDTYSTSTYGFSIATSAPSNGQVLLNADNTLSYVPYANFNGTDAFTYTVTVDDQSDTANVSVTVNPINDAPVITSSAPFSAAENQTAVGTVTATDVDGDTLTYTLTGTDSASLSISSSGMIAFNVAPNYETKTSYLVTVNVGDGTETTTQALTISITNVNEASPVITSSATFSVAENQTAVGTVTATDADGDTLTYTLTGTDSASLSISSSGVITFNVAPDYETKINYSVTVHVGDGTETTTQALTISITNVNDAPVITSSATLSAAENQTDVGTVTATDTEGDTLTYTLTGTDASSLSINSSSGVITFNSAPDYETRTSYSVTVNVSDGTNDTTQTITITITNVNDSAPVITSSATFSVAENQTAVGTVTATDVDGDPLTYTLTGTDASSLSINSSSGVITFNSAPDYETKIYYSVTVNVSDGINPIAQALTITITNVTELGPIFISLPSTLLVAENQRFVYQIRATDVENYSLSGTDAAQFDLPDSGALSFKTEKNFEDLSNIRFDITVTISDGNLTESRNVAVIITDVAENIFGEAYFDGSILE